MRVEYLDDSHSVLYDNTGKILLAHKTRILAITYKDSKVYLDARYWNWSSETGKHRDEFLHETIVVTRRKIADGTYELIDLSGD